LVENEEKYLWCLNTNGPALLELVEMSADRPLTVTERADFMRWANTAAETFRRDAISGTECRPNRHAVVECLRLALSDPQQAAARLIQCTDASPNPEQEYHPPPCYHSALRVMECLWPALWAPSVAWTPPSDAVRWARRMYESRNFTDLPILADLLEDAGCPDRFLLDHCRNYPEHFRGCAALDRLLVR
jgi:hypothetical protein